MVKRRGPPVIAAALCGLMAAAAHGAEVPQTPDASVFELQDQNPAPSASDAKTAADGASEADAAPSPFGLHVQSTLTEQANDGFRSPYQGPNSLTPVAKGRETFDATLFAGVRLWAGGELWINPEIDQGFGLDETLGVAGFPSAEAYKIGNTDPYVRLQRFFIRQTLNLGGATSKVEADQNVLASTQTENRLVLTVGKFSVVDIFDTNKYAHDPKNDFLNWTVVDAGTFDYAADSWGYTAGAALEWYEGPLTARLGGFLLSSVPNSPSIDLHFNQFQLIGELEERHTLFGHAGALRATAFVSRAEMGRLLDAVRLAETDGGAPSTALVRRYAGRPGLSLNLEQEIAKGVGVFARAGAADGRYETYEFTDVDRSLSGGLSVSGSRWGRGEDLLGLAGVVNVASRDRIDYLAAGGLGPLIGDGRLPHPGDEKILETFYAASLVGPLRLSFDYQYVDNPAYNRDRGPASIFALRLHVQL